MFTIALCSMQVGTSDSKFKAEGSTYTGSKIVYNESIKRKLNKRLILDCRCDARLKVNVKELHV